MPVTEVTTVFGHMRLIFFFFRPFKLLASLVSGSSSNPDRILSLHFSFSCFKIKVVRNRAKADR